MRIRHASRRAGAAAALLAASMLLLTACAQDVDTLESGKSVRGALKDKTTAMQVAAETTPEPRPHVPGEVPVLNNGAVTWILPTHMFGWASVPAQDPGVTQLLDQAGCRFASSQHRIKPNPQGTDRSETDQQVQQWIALHERNNIASTSTAVLSTEIGGLGIGPVEMMRVDTDFVSPDGVSHRSTAWLRVFATAKTPMFTTLNYSCPVSSYSAGELQHLKDATLVVNVEKPFMN